LAFSVIALFIFLIILVGIPALIGVYVYRDASRRGMNAPLWALVAVLAPTFVGFIIYLLVRGGYPDLKCPSCAAPVTDQYTACPRCGARLKASCPSCGFPAEPGWTVCPRCASPLPVGSGGFTPPVRQKDTALGKILLVVVLAPVLLIVLLGLFSFSSASRTSAMNTAYLNPEQYEDRPEITAWIRGCAADPSKAYALRCQTESGERKATHYLVYYPSAGDNVGVDTGSRSGLFSGDTRVDFYEPAGPDNRSGSNLICVSRYSDRFEGLKVFLNGKRLDCEITGVDFNPALFEVIGEEALTANEE